MTTRIEHNVNLSVVGPAQNNRLFSYSTGSIVSRMFDLALVRDVHPLSLEDVSHLSFEDRRIPIDRGSDAKFGSILPNHIPVTKHTHRLEPLTSVMTLLNPDSVAKPPKSTERGVR